VRSIFLSHSANDKMFARKLAVDLQRFDAKVWIDEAEIRPGDSLISKIADGVVDAEFLFVVLSATSVASEWVKREVNIALTEEINGKFVKVVPILIDNCKIPAFLLDKKYVDFRGAHWNVDAFWELITWLELDAEYFAVSAEMRFTKRFLCFDLLNNTDRPIETQLSVDEFEKLGLF
jgi:hypothetical protein